MSILEQINWGIDRLYEESRKRREPSIEFVSPGEFMERSVGWKIPRRALRRLRANRTRSSRRTDFARPGRLRFFARGRSYPTKRLQVACNIFDLSVGQVTSDHGVILALDIPGRTAWVLA